MTFPDQERVINSIRLAIAGAGRMGQSVAALAEAAHDLSVAGIWRRGDDLDALLADSDVLIDFSLPEATETIADSLRRRPIPLVCGVSGLPPHNMDLIQSAATSVPVVFDRNMSLGIAALEKNVRQAAKALGPDCAVKISEVHHVHKKDAPSGTALKLGEAIAEALGKDSADFIEYSSERRGEVPGDHEVVLSTATEQLRFSHSVTTRDVFAEGAIKAARWVIGRQPGLYSIADVLFDSDSG